MTKKIIIIIILITLKTYSQTNKNNFEAGVLGNIGFFNIGYTREVLEIKKINLGIGAKIGYVPGSSGNESDTSSPNFTHLNLGPELSFSTHKNRFGIGINYSTILVGNNKNNSREKNNYNRILGDINYTFYTNSEGENLSGVKISFVPIIYDNGALDVQNIPIRLSFTFEL